MENRKIKDVSIEKQEEIKKQELLNKKIKSYAICAIIFGILGGYLSVYFAVYGLKWLYKEPQYSKQRKMCYVGIALFCVWFLILSLALRKQ